MATIKAPSMHNRMYVGAQGNLSMAFAAVTLKAAAVATVVEMLDVPIGISVTGVRVNTSGLGAGAKVDIKLGETLLEANVDVSAAASLSIALPTTYTEEKAVLTATIKGAAATGKLEINPEYVATGY
ncbi:hypothetical protein [Enterovibrio sp. 27052020O]|uniref:hypothetical protein n=1 Tax=Enterovibrio sp. 27052020O TaxID=3241166 RepID=UPI00388DE692